MPRVILFMFMLILAVEPVASADVAPSAYPALDIYLVTDEAPTSDGRESQATLRLKSIMAKVPELAYQIHYVSWPRAIRQVDMRHNALVFQMLRTPKREARYHWLVADQQVPVTLVALVKNPKKDWPLARLIQDQNIRIACLAATAYCEFLLQQGFVGSQIEQISLQEEDSVERVLIAGRVDFIVVAPSDLQRNMQRLQVTPSRYQASHQLIVMEDYLAGSLLLAPEVRQLFRQRFP